VSEIAHKNGFPDFGRARQVAPGMFNQRGYNYDVSNDGKRLLVHIVADALRLPSDPRVSSEQLTLISN
jgi:hypothetical protein